MTSRTRPPPAMTSLHQQRSTRDVRKPSPVSLVLIIMSPYNCRAIKCRPMNCHQFKQPVMLSPRCHFPRGQSGLETKILASASASKLWPRPRHQTFGLGLASISLSYYVIGHFSGKNRGIVNFSGSNLKSYVVNHYWYFFS